MKLTKEAIIDAAKYANFSQRVKLLYWSKDIQHIPEKDLEEILLLAWEDMKGVV